MDQVREVLRYHHYAYRTEQTYCQWILRYIHYFGGKTHPRLLGTIVDLLDQFDGIPRPLEIKTKAKKADIWNVRMSLEMTCYAYWVKYTSMLDADEDIPVGYLNIIKTKVLVIQEQTGPAT